MAVSLTRWASCLVVLIMLDTTTAEQIPQAVLEVFPTQLTLPANSAARARLILRNPSQQVLRGVRLEQDEAPGVKVEVQPEVDQTVNAQSAVTWKLTFQQVVSGTLAEDVRFLVHYTRVGSDKKTIHNVAVTKISLASQPREEVSKAVEVPIHSSLSELNDFRPGYVYIEVKNKSAGPIQVTEVRITERPDFIVLRASASAMDIPLTESVIPYSDAREISAGESRIFPVYVQAGDQVRPGKHLLVFNVYFQRMVDGTVQTGSLVAKHEFQVGVFGEGEILGALTNVSSFLILPGFLLVVMAGLVWQLFVPGTLRNKLDISLSTFTDARFWVVAVTISLLMVWQAYPWLSRILPIGKRNYLYGYGFLDILWMWLMSVVIGAAFSLVVACIAALVIAYRTRREKAEAKKAFQPNDLPLTTFSKAVYQGVQKLKLREATVTESGKKGYLLEDDTPGKTALWVMPRIFIRFHETTTELTDRIDNLLENPDAGLGELVDMLKGGLAAGSNQGIDAIDWDKINTIDRLTQIDKSKLKLGNEVTTFIRHP